MVFGNNVKGWLPLLFIVANFITKGYFLANNSLGGDEPFSVFYAQTDVNQIIEFLSKGNNPPLYEILLHFWIKLFGISEFSVRFPSLIFSSLTIGMIYAFACKFLNLRIAVYASLLFLASNYHVLFSHEARGYALLGLLSIVSVYCFLSLTKNSHSKRKKTLFFLGLALCNSLLFYTHYFGLFIIIIEVIFFLFKIKSFKKEALLFARTLVTTLLLTTPYFSVLYSRYSISKSKGTWLTPPNGIEDLYNMIWDFTNKPIVAVLIIILFTFSIALYFLKRYKYTLQKNTASQFIHFGFFFIILTMFFVSFKIPMFLDRYLMPASILFYLSIAICMDFITERKPYKFITPVIIIAFFGITCNLNIPNKRDVRTLVNEFNNVKREKSLKILSPKNFTINFLYYYDQNLFSSHSIHKITQELKKENLHFVNNISEVPLKNEEHVVFIDAASKFSFPNNNIYSTFTEKYSNKTKVNIDEIFQLYQFEK